MINEGNTSMNRFISNLSGGAIVSAGLRGTICAGLATAVTALRSWSFVASTDTPAWPGSDALLAQPAGDTVEREIPLLG
jgi:uncharacterized membrane protein